MPFSWLDVILVVIMLVSGFLAMVRGFTREVLSIFSWAVAAVAALYLTPRYSDVLTPYINITRSSPRSSSPQAFSSSP